jgi:multicomponent Na+:H+ antiporter subunit A
VVAIAAAWLVSRYPRRASLLAAWPALLAASFGRELAGVIAEGPRRIDLPWAPSLGLTLSFNLDGLGLLFALLITGIGALVVLYASRYLEGHAQGGASTPPCSRSWARCWASFSATTSSRCSCSGS